MSKQSYMFYQRFLTNSLFFLMFIIFIGCPKPKSSNLLTTNPLDTDKINNQNPIIPTLANKIADNANNYIDNVKASKDIVAQKIQSMGLPAYFGTIQQKYLVIDPQTRNYKAKSNLSVLELSELYYFKEYLQENVSKQTLINGASLTLEAQILNSLKDI